jgi:hypothetical protein
VEELNKRKNSNLEAKQIFINMQELVLRVEQGHDRYLIAKFIDMFIKLPSRYQAAFIEYFCAEIPNDRWTKCGTDDTLYLSAVRAITLHFTGLEKANQPHLGDFLKHLKAFVESDFYKRAQVVIKPKKAFTDSLKEL